MKYTRITIGGMALGIGFAAFGLAALRAHTLLWAQVFYTLAPASLLVATVGAVVGRHRAFWIGAAILGWGYWLLVFGPWFSVYAKPWLLSSRIIEEGFDRLVAPGLLSKRFPGQPGVAVSTVDWSGDEDRTYFLQIGQSLSVLIHMAEGGIVGVFLDRKRKRRSETIEPEIR